MTRVYVKDLRPAGVCPRARFWFDTHGLDWPDFVRNGIDAEALRATKDNQVVIEQVIAIAEKREARDGK